MVYCSVSRRSLSSKPLIVKKLYIQGLISVYAQCLKGQENKIFGILRILLDYCNVMQYSIVERLFMTIRQEILKELKRRDWSNYRLAQKLKKKMPERTVYAYLSGECDLVSDRVSIILQALDLQINRKPKKGQRPGR